jgi:hypothetical protein
MKIETFSLILFITHLVIAQGGFLLLTFYKVKSVLDAIKRIVVLFWLWCYINVLSNGCPLTHLENNLMYLFYGFYPMPNYGFVDSWVYKIFEFLFCYIK